MHNTVRRSRRRQAWTERWEGDCQAKTHVVGIAELVGVVGPLSLKELSSNWRKAGFDRNEHLLRLPYEQTFAWVLQNPKRLRPPIPYNHPPGAVIWVRLKPDVEHEVLQQVGAT
jgi:hypothetical protein